MNQHMNMVLHSMSHIEWFNCDAGSNRNNGNKVFKPMVERCLTVIMPVFNEADTIDSIMERVLAQSCVAAVVVVKDRDAQWLQEHCTRLK